MIYLLLPVACVIGMFGLVVVVTGMEKRLVWPYGELEPACQVADPTGYGAATVAEAVRNGFELLGWVRDIKGPKYKVSYAMLLSPDRGTLAIVGVGVVIGIRAQATWLATTRSDRLQWVSSTDHPAAVEPDAIGLGDMRLFSGATFSELLERHQGVVGNSDGGVYQLRALDPLGDFAAIRRERYDWLSRNGMVRFVDTSCTAWRYTLNGAVRITVKREIAKWRGGFGGKPRR